MGGRERQGQGRSAPEFEALGICSAMPSTLSAHRQEGTALRRTTEPLIPSSNEHRVLPVRHSVT